MILQWVLWWRLMAGFGCPPGDNFAMRCLLAAGILLASNALAEAWERNPHDLVGHTSQGRVITVVDGDTADVLLTSKRTIRVRFDGIDCPESGEPFSQQARTFTRVLMFSKDVTVEGKEIDRYGRLVARVKVGTTDSSLRIIEAGLACHFRRFSSDPILEAGEKRARAAALGFWATGVPQPQCVAREARGQVPNSAATPIQTGFVGNTNSRVYHSPACRNFNCKNCTQHFSTESEAKAAGFRPAGDCLPKK